MSIFTKNYVVIDFETQIYNQRKHKPVCLGYKFKNNDVDILTDFELIKEFCIGLFQMKDLYIIAHNANYEMFIIKSILKNKFKNKYLLNFISSDTVSLLQGSQKCLSLKDQLNFWDLPVKKQEIGEDLIKILSFPYSEKTPKKILGRKTKEMKKINNFIIDKELYNYFFSYCKQDVIATETLFNYIWTEEYWNQKCHIDYALNFMRNFEGIPIDKTLVEQLIINLDNLKLININKAKAITKNPGFNLNSPKQMQEFLNLKSTQKQELVRNYKHFNKTQKSLAKLRIEAPKNLSKKLHKIKFNRAYDNFFYCGTGLTRRFTSFGFNFLNIPRKEKKVNIKDFYAGKYTTYSEFKSLVRNVIYTEKMFYGGDFSQIELRLLLLQIKADYWLKKLLEGFDVYVYIATKIFNKKNITSSERYIAKRAVLAFGYGMGVNKLKTVLEGENIYLDETLLFKIKFIYHSMFPQVKPYWDKLMNTALKDKKIIVPFSKRIMPFYYIKKQDFDYLIKRGNSWEPFWGGHLTGLVTQGLAADVFNWKIRYLYKNNFKTILPFHDEVVCEVNHTDKKYRKFKKVMEVPPPWLPLKKLNCDFWLSNRYNK